MGGWGAKKSASHAFYFGTAHGNSQEKQSLILFLILALNKLYLQ